MCEIPNNYRCVEDVIDELKSLKARMELDIDNVLRHINEVIYWFTGECERLQEPLREMEFISDKLEKKIQARIDKLPHQQSD